MNRGFLAHWREGDVTAVQVTVAVWDEARPTLDTIARWYRVLRDHGDILVPATSGTDIAAAKAVGKTAVVLGFQNTSPFEHDLGLVEVFHRLGIRIAQCTCNHQNFVGGSCYDPIDSSLTRFGKFVLGEMNRLGMVMDLSHVGDRTSLDTIAASAPPVVITHANPRFFHDHVRNKTDEVLRALAVRGGVLGLATYPALCPKGTTLEEWCEMVARAVDLMGIAHVGLGSDCALDWTTKDGMAMNMWHWSHEPNYGAHSESHPGWDPLFDWWQSLADYPNITRGLLARGFSKAETAAVMGRNWMRVFSEGFEPGG